MMGTKIINTLRAFRWPQWLALGLFLLAVSLTTLQIVHTTREVRYWRVRRDEPIRGWMTVGYVAHSYGVPPSALCTALGLPPQPDRRPLRAIAKAQHRSMDEVRALLKEAISQAHPLSAPTPPTPKRGGVR